MRSSIPRQPAAVTARRRCLVCDWTETVIEAPAADDIGGECSRCHAPTERIEILARRATPPPANPHAAALGRLGGLKGGPARAAALTARRRRAIAKAAALARWNAGKGPGTKKP
jgi:hypothetical protein